MNNILIDTEDVNYKIKKNYEDLANAIIVQASKDYLFAFRSNNAKEIERLERFFNSKYFEILSNASPEYIIEKIRELSYADFSIISDYC